MNIVEFFKQSILLYFGEKKSSTYIQKKVEWWQALLLAVGVSTLASVVSLFVNQISSSALEVVLLLVGTIIMGIVGSFISYGILQLFFMLFKGKGTYLETIKAASFLAVFPSLLHVILSFIPESLYLGVENIFENFILLGIISFAMVCVFVWSVVISVKLFKKIHKLSTGKTVLVVLLPLILLFILGIIILGTFIALAGTAQYI